jgi:ferredoxin
MQIDSETDEVRGIRRTALELLFSDHVGDCLAPCYFACPAHMDIPLMLRQIGEHDLREAIATVKQDIALPAVLGRVCPKPCEKGCRRNAADGPVAVCDLKRFVADMDLESGRPYLPPCAPSTGKRVAIVGAGPTGLSAGYYLLQQGHECVLFEEQSQPGGRLRQEPTATLPLEILDTEIGLVFDLGAELRTNVRVDDLESLVREYDVVLLTCGRVPPEQVNRWGLSATKRGIEVNRDTFQTPQRGVFAAGNAIRPAGLVVRSVADGKEVAHAIGQYLAGEPITPTMKPFSTHIGTLQQDEARRWTAIVSDARREVPLEGTDYPADVAATQSQRCLSCGCVGHGSCRLEQYAIEYGVDPTKFAGERRLVEIVQRPGGVRFEPGKCIKCELCVQVSAAAGEPLGLTLVARGFDVRLAVPFDRSLDEALTKVAAECVAVCPTAALSFDRERVHSIESTR